MAVSIEVLMGEAAAVPLKFLHTQGKRYFNKLLKIGVVSALCWDTRNEQIPVSSLSSRQPPHALDPLLLPELLPFAPLPKSHPKTTPCVCSAPFPIAAPPFRSCGTDFLLLPTPEPSSQKGPPPPGATPPRSSPSARKMANNQGNTPSASS